MFNAEAFISTHPFNTAFMGSFTKILEGKEQEVVTEEIIKFQTELRKVIEKITRMKEQEDQRQSSGTLLYTFVNYTNEMKRLQEYGKKNSCAYNYCYSITRIIIEELTKLLQYGHIKEIKITVLDYNKTEKFFSIEELCQRYRDGLMLTEKIRQRNYYAMRKKIPEDYRNGTLFSSKNLQQIILFLQNAYQHLIFKSKAFGDKKVIKEEEPEAEILYSIDTLNVYFYEKINSQDIESLYFFKKNLSNNVKKGNQVSNIFNEISVKDLLLKSCHLMLKVINNIDAFEKNKEDKIERGFDLSKCKKFCYLNAIDFHYLHGIMYRAEKNNIKAIYHLNYSYDLITQLEKYKFPGVGAKKTSLLIALYSFYSMLLKSNEGIIFFKEALECIEKFQNDHNEIEKMSKDDLLLFALEEENGSFLRLSEVSLQVVDYYLKNNLIKEANELCEKLIAIFKKQVKIFSAFSNLSKYSKSLNPKNFETFKKEKFDFSGSINIFNNLLNELFKRQKIIEKTNFLRNIENEIQQKCQRNVGDIMIGDENNFYVKINYNHPFTITLSNNKSLRSNIMNLYKDIAEVKELKAQNDHVNFKITLYKDFEKVEIINKLLKKEKSLKKITDNLNNPKPQQQNITNPETTNNNSLITNTNTFLDENLKNNSLPPTVISKNPETKKDLSIKSKPSTSSTITKNKKNTLILQESIIKEKPIIEEKILNPYQKQHQENQIRKKIEMNSTSEDKDVPTTTGKWRIKNKTSTSMSSCTFFNKMVHNDEIQEIDIKEIAKTLYPISNTIITEGLFFIKFDEKFLGKWQQSEFFSKSIELAEKGNIVPSKGCAGIVFCPKESNSTMQLIKLKDPSYNERFYSTASEKINIINNVNGETTEATVFTIDTRRIHR